MELKKLENVVSRVLEKHRGMPYQLEIKMQPKPMQKVIELAFTTRTDGKIERRFFELTSEELVKSPPLKLYRMLSTKVNGIIGVRGFEAVMQTQEKIRTQTPVDAWLEEYDRRDTTTHGKA